jgi:hypothetical protein
MKVAADLDGSVSNRQQLGRHPRNEGDGHRPTLRAHFSDALPERFLGVCGALGLEEVEQVLRGSHRRAYLGHAGRAAGDGQAIKV